MKLHWSPRSPFVRKVMIFAEEAGVVDQINCVRSVAIRTTLNPEIAADSPVGRIPVLVLDDGIVLSGSYTICEYLDTLHDGRKLIPESGQKRWRELELHGVSDGLLDTLVNWRGEFMKSDEQRWREFFDTCAAKTTACLDWLDQRCTAFSDTPYGIGQITTGIALDYLDFRYESIGWRDGREALCNWHKTFLQRASTQSTEIVNDE